MAALMDAQPGDENQCALPCHQVRVDHKGYCSQSSLDYKKFFEGNNSYYAVTRPIEFPARSVVSLFFNHFLYRAPGDPLFARPCDYTRTLAVSHCVRHGSIKCRAGGKPGHGMSPDPVAIGPKRSAPSNYVDNFTTPATRLRRSGDCHGGRARV
jgi:hypothetical protein